MRKTHFPPLDGLRGIAVLLVILVHTVEHDGHSVVGAVLDNLGHFGWAGVPLFFVLSGFLITGILLDTRGQPNYLRDFYARRSLRIFPLYFAFLAANFYLFPRLPVTDALPQPRPENQIYFWTYTSNMIAWLSGNLYASVPALLPTWSLAVEEQVYLVWPWMILIVPRQRLALMFGLCALGSFTWRVWSLATAQHIEFLYSFTFANMESFAIGGALALFCRERPGAVRLAALPGAAIAAGCVLALWGAMGHFDLWKGRDHFMTYGRTFLNLLFAAIIAISVTRPVDCRFNRALSAGWLRRFGKYSYAIYLFHCIFVELLKPAIFSKHTGFVFRGSVVGCFALALTVTAASYLTAWFSWHLLEAPFLKLKRFFPLSSEAVALKPTSLPAMSPWPALRHTRSWIPWRRLARRHEL